MRTTLRPALRVAAAATCLLGALGAGIAGAQETERFSREVPATQAGWIETEITLALGESAQISAFGRSSWDGGVTFSDPLGTAVESCPPLIGGLPLGALLARVGDGPAVVAAGATLTGPGRVALAYNDCADQYFDNSGTYTVTLLVSRVPAAAASPAAAEQPPAEPAPVETPPATSDGGVPWLVIGIVLACIGAAGAAGVRFVLLRPRPRFDPSARLESSAWLAPMHLRDLQGERLPKQALTIGGPDADIDFGVPGVRARFVPTVDGATRIESVGAGRIMINDVPLILGQRLSSGQRVRIGERELVYFEERGPQERRTRGRTALDKPDPRVAA
jgi:hypothetical protein